jgi:hypothetical protein
MDDYEGQETPWEPGVKAVASKRTGTRVESIMFLLTLQAQHLAFEKVDRLNRPGL